MLIDYEDARVRVSRLIVGPIANNVYFITCKATGDSLMIDAANEPELLVKTCSELHVRQVVQTHGHWDHIAAIAAVRSAGLPVAIGKGDSASADHDSLLEDGGNITIGELRIQQIATPGHTPGSFCFTVDGAPLLFTGDTLFPGGPGATRSPGSDFDTIIESITGLFDRFDDHTNVLPGHGDSTTIGTERPALGDWKARRF